MYNNIQNLFLMIAVGYLQGNKNTKQCSTSMLQKYYNHVNHNYGNFLLQNKILVELFFKAL